MTKPNFKQMNLKELRKYVLAHRDDENAWREYAERPRESTVFPPSSHFEEHLGAIEQIVQRKERKQP